MAQFTYDKFINVNSAPKNAHHIGVYNSSGTKVGEIPLGVLDTSIEDTPLYSFGLLSDIHVDSTDYNYTSYLETYPYSDEGEGDFRRALNWFVNQENVSLVCACGDLSQNGTTSEFAMPQAVIDECLPGSRNIPFYTCTGNHDTKTAGANGFGDYFLRTLETTWDGMTDFERSSAFDESFCFTKTTGTKTDHFIFFSMYQYSLGDSASPYLDADITWLSNKLASFEGDRCFIFTHLFFPEYAGNLGRINGSGGIYPSGNWLGGTQLTSLMKLFKKYPKCVWFSGHSHWKWDLQKYQSNITVARYGSDGAWTVHVPSCALPIDSDYSSTTSETTTSREEKPLESQGGVVDVYEDYIILRGIDFNINTSQNGDTTQNYSGSDYVRYLPIAVYNLNTNGEESETVIVGVDNMRINISGDRSENNGQTITSETDSSGNVYTTVEFTNSSQSCILTSDTFTTSVTKLHVSYDDVTIKLLKVADNTETEVPVADIDDYLGWLNTMDDDGNTAYTFDNDFDYTYNITEEYSCYKYGDDSSTAENHIGIQFNTSSKLAKTSSTYPCWIDTYLTDDDRATFVAGTESTYHIIVTFKNLKVVEMSSSDSGESEETTESNYLQKDNFVTNTNKNSPDVDTYIQDLDDDYVAVSFNATSTGFWVIPNNIDSSASTATLNVVDLKVYSGLNTTSGTTISLPNNVGFYNGSSYSGTKRYQIATGFTPSTTEDSSNPGRLQFQTSSSYSGGSITIVMKVEVIYS